MTQSRTTSRRYRWNPTRLLMSALFVLTVVGIVGGLGFDRLAVSAEAGRSPHYREVTVAAGDTLWAIAGRLDIPGDRRDVIERIRDLNGLGARSIQPGEVLRVPTD